MPGGRLDGRQARLVDAGVADRLALHEGAVADQVGEQHDLVVVARRDLERRRHVPYDADPVTGDQLTDGSPAAEGQEGVVSGRPDPPARGELDVVDLAGAAREGVGEG